MDVQPWASGISSRASIRTHRRASPHAAAARMTRRAVCESLRSAPVSHGLALGPSAVFAHSRVGVSVCIVYRPGALPALHLQEAMINE